MWENFDRPGPLVHAHVFGGKKAGEKGTGNAREVEHAPRPVLVAGDDLEKPPVAVADDCARPYITASGATKSEGHWWIIAVKIYFVDKRVVDEVGDVGGFQRRV